MGRYIRSSILISFFIWIIFYSGCSSSGKTEVQMGNTNGNISNGGFSVMHEDWIYFVNFSDSGLLYKIKTDGTGETKVCDDNASYLNSVGDWIYYSNSSENNKLYKIKPDGTERTLVSDIASFNVVLYKDWIYFIDYTDANNSDSNGKIFRIKTDGKGKEKVNDDKVATFNIAGDWIYYVKQDEQKIYKVKIDGKGSLKVSDTSISIFNVNGKYIYYIDSSDGNNNIWRMKTDGTDSVRLSEDKASIINTKGDFIYYMNTLSEASDFEIKRMKLDGTQSSVINGDDPMIINVHGDWLLYIGMNLTDFSIKQTIVKTDGTGRKDYLIKQTPQTHNVERYKMKEKVKAGNISATVSSAYSTNIIESHEPGFQSQIFDEVTDGMYLFVNMVIKNESDKKIDLKQMIGVIQDINAMGLTVYWGSISDITKQIGKEDIKFHLPWDAYAESMVIEPAETRELQALYFLEKMEYPLYLGLFNGTNTVPLVALEVVPSEEYYVVSWALSMKIIKEKFKGYDINQLDGIGYKFKGDKEEKMYYTFEVKKTGTSEIKYYLVKRDTGEIFTGAFDKNYPDFVAVPISLVR